VGADRPGPELLVLPGLGAIDYLVPWMEASRVPVTVLDLPGYRGGGARSCPPLISGIAQCCVRWLAATGRTGVVLAGHSTGAQSAIRVAAQCPDRVAFLLLLAPTFLPAARTLPGLLRRGGATFLREDPRELRSLVASYGRAGGWPVARLLRDGMKDEPQAAAAALTVPVGVICGSHDRLAPPSWGTYLAGLVGGRATVVPGAHNFCFTAAEELAHACADLLAAARIA
jgi:pimeloyl-ACP methyl ester carboxylesterase